MTGLYIDNEQYIFIDEEVEGDIPQDLIERYNLALLEWETVQDELSEIYKGQ